MITGKRVTLRPFRREDLPILRRWHDDGEVMRYWGERQPVVAEDKFEAAAVAAIAAAPQDVEALRAQVGAVGQACAGCHEAFRRPSN